MLEIVVAYYNNNNFEKLLPIFSENKITIYDKSNIYLNEQFKNIIKLENTGREGETYLRHIIENYDNLSDYTLFIQDDTNEHIKSYSFFYDVTTKIICSKTLFYQYPTTWRKGGKIIKRTITNGYCNLHTLPSAFSIKETCTKFNIYIPKSYNTETCAFFIVHKDIIHKRSKEFYINLRLWLLDNEKNGFVLEHIWKLIFL